MKFTVNWLKKYIDFDLPNNELADRLTMAGLEVDSVESLCPALDGVIVARINEVHPHPNADKLTICRVNTKDRDWSVVCGAPNVQEGMLAPLAKPGTIFPDGSQLGKSVIRGESSEGMLCSEAELGLGIHKSGIMALESSLNAGDGLAVALGRSAAALELDLTPHRPDRLSVLGRNGMLCHHARHARAAPASSAGSVLRRRILIDCGRCASTLRNSRSGLPGRDGRGGACRDPRP